MNRHASMNRIYRLVWSQVRSAWVPVAETARGRGKSGGSKSIPGRNLLAAAISIALAPLAHGFPAAPPCVAPACGNNSVAATAHPVGGQVVSGSASITQAGNVTEVRQSSADVSIDWLSFSIGAQSSVDFLQPSASAIAVNRITGTNGSQILGHLNANGQVYLINPSGILFGQGAQVNVGGLVASTLDVSDSSLDSDAISFAGSGTGSVTNEGTINAAAGGYVALLGNRVSNQGVITAQLGTVALDAGRAMTLGFSGNQLVHLQVDQSTLNNLAQNGQLIQANGGLVIMSAGAKNALLASVVNNTGVIEARTVENHRGTIELLGGMTAGTVNVGGTLDASAPGDGNGGLIETSAAHVEVGSDSRITTAAARGLTGTWLVDPQDFTIAPRGGDITGATLSTELGTTSVTLLSSSGATAGSGNINVDDTVSWSTHTLTLTAANNINVNAVMTATGSASLAMNPSTANGADAAVPGGAVVMGLSDGGFTGMVNFSGTGTLSINGTPYTVINSLGAPGSITGADLQGMEGNLAGNYALGSNINASATSTWNSGAGFAPIGSSITAAFKGIFDGLGHTISNLTMNRPSTSPVGLFGVSYGLVRNVGVSGSVIGSSYVGGLAGYNYGTVNNSYTAGSAQAPNGTVGGLVGRNEGNINNSFSMSNVSSSKYWAGGVAAINDGYITNSYATGNVSGGSAAGGLVGISGYFGGYITNCFATGSVTGNSSIGGLMGVNSGEIIDSHASGKVIGSMFVGGLVGVNAGGISNSYATGSVSGAQYVGGLVGQLAFGGNANYGGVNTSYATGTVSGTTQVGGLVGSIDCAGCGITNSYSTGRVSGTGANVGGLVGYNYGTVVNSFWNTTTSGQSSSAGGTGLTTAQMLTAANFSGFMFTTTPGASGWVMVDADGTLNNAAGAAGATFPMLASEYSTTIESAHQLQLVAMNPGANYTLGRDINMSTTGSGGNVWGSAGFIPIGNSGDPFTGTFNGLGYSISGLTIDLPAASNVGLFGYTGSSSVIENVGLVGGTVSGYHNVGDLVGDNLGSINGSYANGSVVGAGTSVGGLVGANARYATISVSYATGAVAGSASYDGGLVGFNGGFVVDSYSAGAVTGPSGLGGLVGFSNKGTVSGSFWDVSTSGQSTSGGGIGMTTANMQNQANFTSATAANGNVNPAWDFINTWVMYDGYTYPLLRSFMTPLTVTANGGIVNYTGSAYNGSLGVVYSEAPNNHLHGTLAFTGPSGPAVNAGTYVVTPIGLYSDQQGYIISYGSGAVTINPLASVKWVGGTVGNWSTASNWAGGAIPDYANVESVLIPAGITVTYDSGVPGTTLLTKLTDSGNFVMAAGTLSTTGSVSTAGYRQTGGQLDVGGTLSIASTSGSVTLGDITAGRLSVSSSAGAITQLASTSLDVTGTTTLTADNGLTGESAVDYAITLANTGNRFVGAVTSTGSNIDLVQSTGSLILGATTANGTLSVDSLDGAITQSTGKAVTVTGTTSLTSDNGTGGFDAVTLGQAGNNLAGTVTAEGSAITLKDSSALTAVLDSSGASTLTSVGAMNVSGTVDTTLKTTTTGTGATTTFGATTVGTSLDVTSTGAVTETASNILTVDGKGTTTVSNAHVTVNGVKGARIPSP